MFKNIISKTEKIINQQWVPSMYKGTGGMGITFEKLLNIETNTFEIPDYDNIEIKTKLYDRGGYISLFNATPDSYLFEIRRIRDTYGYPYSKDKELKVFNISVYSNKKVYIGNNLWVKLKIDKIKKRIFLLIINKYNNILDSDCSWSFELLKEKIYRKLKYLLLVYGTKKERNNITFYKYLKYHCYKLKNFENFLSCLETGDIRISFKIGVIRFGDKRGNIKDHGTSFDIEKSKLYKIYDEIVVK